MIEIVYKDKSVKKRTPYYLLVYNYMIGDADGNTKKEVELTVNNPYIERYVTLLNNLKPTKGNWGISLTHRDLEVAYKEGQLREEDYEFLKTAMFGDEEYEDDGFIYEFYEGVRSEMGSSFLVFQSAELFYSDEYGKKHPTIFK